MRTCHVVLTLELQEGSLVPVTAGLYSEGPMSLTNLGRDYMSAEVFAVRGESYQAARDMAVKTLVAMAEYSAPHALVLTMTGEVGVKIRSDLAEFILEELTGECDVCGETKHKDELHELVAFGMDTTACDDCMGGES